VVDVPEEEQNRAMVVGSGITSAEIVQNRTVHGLVLENWLEVRVCSERMPMAEDVVPLRMVGNTPLALVGV
jgi:hypothetical protein